MDFGTYAIAFPKRSNITSVNIAVKRLKTVVRTPLLTARVERVIEPDDIVDEVRAQATFAAPRANTSWLVSSLSALSEARLLPIENASIIPNRAIAKAHVAVSRRLIALKSGIEIFHSEADTALSLSTSSPKNSQPT